MRVIARIPSVHAFGPLKNTLATGTIPTSIKAALADTTKGDNKAAKTATITAALATQAIFQAITKAQKIDTDTIIASVEKANRKKAGFGAAEWIGTGVNKDVTTGAVSTALTPRPAGPGHGSGADSGQDGRRSDQDRDPREDHRHYYQPAKGDRHRFGGKDQIRRRNADCSQRKLGRDFSRHYWTSERPPPSWL